ncbi:N-alpha-acetyltransferase 16, NatA auxiliary subunit [Orobanche hederae]
MGWKVRCAECFPYSTYFEGSHSSAVANKSHTLPENGSQYRSFADQSVSSLSSNGNVEKIEESPIDLAIQ